MAQAAPVNQAAGPDNLHVFHVNGQSSPFRGSYQAKRKSVPTMTMREAYQTLDTEETLNEYKEKDIEEDWPTEPRPLKKRTTLTYMALCWDVLVTLVPVVFFVFGACAIYLNKKPLSKFGANILEGNRLGPTVFPIVFAAIAARLVRGIALRRVERGTQLGLLEQLVGSQSLAGAIERIVLLRRFGIVGTAIIILWLLSPLGGQCSLRTLTITDTNIPYQRPIRYFNVSSAEYDISSFSSASTLDYDVPVLRALLLASFLEPESVRNSPVDLWNNVKIPRLDELSPFKDMAPGNPWIVINQTADTVWSSLSGLMIQGLPATGVTTFTLESSYVDLTCSDSTVFNASLNGSYSEVLKEGLLSHNTNWPFSAPSVGDHTDLNATSSFFMDSSTSASWWGPKEQAELKTPLNLLYASNLADGIDGNQNALELFNCSLGVARVESDLTCHGTSCAANRMRRSEINTMSSFTTPFGFSEYVNMLSFLPFAAGVMHSMTTSPIDQYILGSNSPMVAGVDPISPNFSGVTGQVFSKRLMTILNTISQNSLAAYSIALGATGNFSSPPNYSIYIPSTNTTATITEQVPIYAADYLFIGLLFIITLILQICAIAGLILKYTATAPDILGYVSTMTRDNPHMVLPPGGHTLDGLERARYLSKMEVQLADIAWDKVEGHIAFTNMDTKADLTKGKLSKKKLYR